MGLLILIDIPIRPIPYKAPYVSRKRTFNPRYKEILEIKSYVRDQYDGDLIDYAVEVDYTFYFLPPKYFSKKKTLAAVQGEIVPTVRPDVSNIVKLTEDCLVGTVLKDDSFVVDIHARKRYSTREHTVIKISPYFQRRGP